MMVTLSCKIVKQNISKEVEGKSLIVTRVHAFWDVQPFQKRYAACVVEKERQGYLEESREQRHTQREK